MWFFVFSINFARTREGRPARRKLTELLVKSKKTLVTEPAAIFFVFQVNISCKTTSIILYFKYASFSVVTRKKRQNTNPHPDGNFFDDRFGLGILRDVIFSSCKPERRCTQELVCSQVVRKCNSVAVNENHSERTRQNVFAILRSLQYPLGRQDIVY